MVPNILISIVILVTFWMLARFVYQWMLKAFKKTHLNESLEHLLANTCRVIVICVGIVFALSVLELQKTVFSLLAGVGVIGLALGFAFQDLAANFISGIMLAIRAPIKIDDVIKINDTMGTVIDIRLRDSLIRNFDGQDVFIPNKEFTSNKLTNYSSFGRRKVQLNVGIGYENDPKKALKIIEETVSKIDGVLSDPEPRAFVESLGDSSVNIICNVWFKYPGGSYLQIRNDATIEIKTKLEDAGFNLPFPVRTLDIPKQTLLKLSSESNHQETLHN